MIINCKCLKYQFDIPSHEITGEGRQVRCEFCNEEWFQTNPENNLEQNNTQSSTEKEIPIPKIYKELSSTKDTIQDTTQDKTNKFSFLFLSFIIILFVIYFGMLENKDLILSNYPSFIGFFESSDILKEIMTQNINWLKESFQNLINQ